MVYLTNAKGGMLCPRAVSGCEEAEERENSGKRPNADTEVKEMIGMGNFEIKEGSFWLDGNPFQIISGSIHYFRVVPEYWRDRLEKLKAMGCNTVETYIPWNLHEPRKGEFCFSGMLDVAKFVSIAGELGLKAILRPAPYICAEWEWGGFPPWLMKEPGLRLRTSHPGYLKAVEEYYERLFRELAPLQITRGGPVILFQIENEYGSYGNDKDYLRALKKMMEKNGVEVPFVTSDGAWDDALRSGTLPDVHPTANFGSRTEERFGILSRHTKGPLMCMEFWVGWFDHWGCGKHSTSDLEENKKDFEDLLRLGNVNIYMFHGGTNFGFMNGSNYYDELTPDVTSYDYDAVLSEDGELTPKYRAFQEIIRKYAPVPEVEFSTVIRRRAYGKLQCEEKVGLFASLGALSTSVRNPWPLSMEELDQNWGYVLYRTVLSKGDRIEKIKLLGAGDRAQVFFGGEPVTTFYDRELLEERETDLFCAEDSSLSILTENMGRVNFGPRIESQKKGIAGGVLLNARHQFGWEMFPLPMDNLEKLDFSKGWKSGEPAFYQFHFQVEKGDACDTFLDFTDWGKGFAVLNGFNLGRFWEKGPQKRLYIPAPLLKEGENELILFESEGKTPETVSLEKEPLLE